MSEKTERELAQANIAENRKAFHDFHLLESFEAGLVLLGTEVKAIREGRVNLRDSYARTEGGEVWMMNVHISPYSHRGYADHAEKRDGKNQPAVEDRSVHVRPPVSRAWKDQHIF